MRSKIQQQTIEHVHRKLALIQHVKVEPLPQCELFKQGRVIALCEEVQDKHCQPSMHAHCEPMLKAWQAAGSKPEHEINVLMADSGAHDGH